MVNTCRAPGFTALARLNAGQRVSMALYSRHNGLFMIMTHFFFSQSAFTSSRFIYKCFWMVEGWGFFGIIAALVS